MKKNESGALPHRTPQSGRLKHKIWNYKIPRKKQVLFISLTLFLAMIFLRHDGKSTGTKAQITQKLPRKEIINKMKKWFTDCENMKVLQKVCGKTELKDKFRNHCYDRVN